MIFIIILVCILFYLLNRLYTNRQSRIELVKQQEIEKTKNAQIENVNNVKTIVTLQPLPGPVIPTFAPTASPTITPTETPTVSSIGVFNPSFEQDCEKVSCDTDQKKVNQHYDVLRALATRIIGKADINKNVLCYKNQKSFVADNRSQISQREKNINIIANEAIMKSMIEGNFENLGRLYLLINKVILNDGVGNGYVFTAYDRQDKEVPRLQIANGSPIEYVTIKQGSGSELKIDKLQVYPFPNDQSEALPRKGNKLTEEYTNFKKYILGKGDNDRKTIDEQLNDLKAKDRNSTKIPLDFFGRYATYLYNTLRGDPNLLARRGLLKIDIEKRGKYDHLKLNSNNDKDGSYRRSILKEFKEKGIVNDENQFNELVDKNMDLTDYAVCS
jgi:hypothetical protein